LEYDTYCKRLGPQAALIPYEDFVRYQQFEKAQVIERFDHLLGRRAELNTGYSDAEIEADLEAPDRERLEKNATGGVPSPPDPLAPLSGERGESRTIVSSETG
jgi:hypothetical protein